MNNFVQNGSEPLCLGWLITASRSALIWNCSGDHDDVDEAEMPAECYMHGKIIHKLFVERECLTVPGFTYIMMETLKRPRTYILHGKAKTVGSTDGVSQGVVDACLRRMTKFSVLVSAVLAAEFPTFHIMSAFRVFSLSQNKRSEAGHGSAATADLREDRCALSTAIGTMHWRRPKDAHNGV